VRRRWNLVPGLVAALVALLGVAVAVPLTVVASYLPPTVVRNRPLWIGLLAGLAIAIAVSAWLSGSPRRPVSAGFGQVPQVRGWVERAELAEIMSALTATGSGTVALTTGLVGAGGFGKTTLAARACQDRRVRQLFRGGIVWVTVGQHASGPGLADLINGAIADIGGDAPPSASPEQAGHALARALAARDRTLLVVDDVWTAAQLEPFANAAQPGRLLVTTRRPGSLAGIAARRIPVDAMTDAVAQRLLTRRLPPMATEREHELLRLAGGWPLLLNLVNRRLAEDVDRGASMDAAAAQVAARLREVGPAALDISDSGKRETMAAATIGYSLDAVEAGDRDRFFELGIFAEDAEIPVTAVALLWQGTARMGRAAAESLCERLDGLSLVTLTWDDDVRLLVIHDVIRNFARGELGPQRLAELNGSLVDAVAAGLPAAAPLNAADPGLAQVAWWELGRGGAYLWDHLIEHLRDAGRGSDAEAVACDLRWAGARLEMSGPAAPAADLLLAGTPKAARLEAVLTRSAHLLASARPAGAVVDVLHSRVADDPDWGRRSPPCGTTATGPGWSTGGPCQTCPAQRSGASSPATPAG
jgi:hypothetical protein